MIDKQTALLEAKIALYRILKSQEAVHLRHDEPIFWATKAYLALLEGDPHMHRTLYGHD